MGPWLRSHGRVELHAAIWQPGIGASMGPWLRSHGRAIYLGSTDDDTGLQWGRGFAATEGGIPSRFRPCTRCFNGAVASQPRKADESVRAVRGQSRFNGAVASQPRKGGRGVGRGIRPDASMGPWLRSHGRRPPALRRRASPPSFNGAVASQPRKAPSAGLPSIGGGRASMGPWLRSHGRPVMPRNRTSFFELQWGRGFAATEG